MPKEYIVLGSNNFWYATCQTLKEAKETVKDIMEGGSYGNPENGDNPEMPEETIYIYEAKEVERVNVEKDDEDENE